MNPRSKVSDQVFETEIEIDYQMRLEKVLTELVS